MTPPYQEPKNALAAAEFWISWICSTQPPTASTSAS
jgi:hypothetical protein